MKPESWIYKFLKWLGIIKQYKMGKPEMCKMAQGVCTRECEHCAWNGKEKI